MLQNELVNIRSKPTELVRVAAEPFCLVCGAAYLTHAYILIILTCC